MHETYKAYLFFDNSSMKEMSVLWDVRVLTIAVH